MYFVNTDRLSKSNAKETSNQESRQNGSKFIITADLNSGELAASIERQAKKELVDEFKAVAKELILKKTYMSIGYASSSPYELKEWVMEAVKEEIHNNRDLIIEMAAAKLADSMRRSKPVREKFGELLEDELNGL